MLDKLASQPLLAIPSQLSKPALHVRMHMPLEHIATPFAGLTQGESHAPQWSRDVRVSTHAPPQRACPGGHIAPVSATTPVSELTPVSVTTPVSPVVLLSGVETTSFATPVSEL